MYQSGVILKTPDQGEVVIALDESRSSLIVVHLMTAKRPEKSITSVFRELFESKFKQCIFLPDEKWCWFDYHR